MPVLIRPAAKTEPVVVALIEHAKGTHRGAGGGVASDGKGRQALRQTLTAGDVAGRHRGHHRERQVIIQVADPTRSGRHVALRRPVYIGNQTVELFGEHPKRLLVIVVPGVDPADLTPDASDACEVGLMVVSAYLHSVPSYGRR